MATSNYKAKVLEFDELLNSEVINIQKLKELSFHGIPDEQGLRALTWKLLLEYLPVVRNTWKKFLSEKRQLYSQFIHDFIVTPGIQRATGDNHDNGNPLASTPADCDHPLNPNPSSQWSVYFKENDVLMQIDKDVRRLCPDMSFFQRATSYPCTLLVLQQADGHSQHILRARVESSMLQVANVTRNRQGIQEHVIPLRKKAPEEYLPLGSGEEAHWEVVERILFIYAKLNPGQGYVQGINEIIGPIYYTFASDTDKEWTEHAEADTFFCFTNLMSEIRDHFIKTLESESGICSLMRRLSVKLKQVDLEVHLRLEQQELRPQFYQFRWLTLLLSQEFPLPDVVRIWDSLFADEQRFSFLIDVCLAMIILCRNQLLTQDFSHNMKLLQNFPSTDIHVVLARAVECREKHSPSPSHRPGPMSTSSSHPLS